MTWPKKEKYHYKKQKCDISKGLSNSVLASWPIDIPIIAGYFKVIFFRKSQTVSKRIKGTWPKRTTSVPSAKKTMKYIKRYLLKINTIKTILVLESRLLMTWPRKTHLILLMLNETPLFNFLKLGLLNVSFWLRYLTKTKVFLREPCICCNHMCLLLVPWKLFHRFCVHIQFLVELNAVVKFRLLENGI